MRIGLMSGADCWKDHRLVISKLNRTTQLVRRSQGKKSPKRQDVSKLNQDSMRQEFLTTFATTGCSQSHFREPRRKLFYKTAATTFLNFYRRHYESISKFNVELKTLLREGISEPEIYGDLVYKF